jgi:hypothetical protein
MAYQQCPQAISQPIGIAAQMGIVAAQQLQV